MLEAQDGKEKYERGVEQAENYRKFLDAFKERLWTNLNKRERGLVSYKSPKIDLETTTMPIGGFYVTDIRQCVENARADVGFPSNEKIDFDLEEIAQMTPSEFLKKIDELKASLRKEDSVPNIKSEPAETV